MTCTFAHFSHSHDSHKAALADQTVEKDDSCHKAENHIYCDHVHGNKFSNLSLFCRYFKLNADYFRFSLQVLEKW